MFIDIVESIMPISPEWKIDWKKIEASKFGVFFQSLQKTKQNPEYHGEGDVLTHTKMVCEALVKDEDFRICTKVEQIELFVAALLHDIGKIRTTRIENGILTSPNHSIVGSKMAREFLWKEFELCGTAKKQNIRETICSLIRHHMQSGHIIYQKNPEFTIIKTSSEGECAKDFNWHLLSILSKADTCGRIAASSSIDDSLEQIEICKMLAKENNCFEQPFKFTSEYTRRIYLLKKNIIPSLELYDSTWGEVILMSGLPGTGKDTWIKKYFSEYPMISLDNIRRELNISPAKEQGKVIGMATERAKEYLRNKQTFVWNATNITADIRQKQIDLFERYGASVRIVYLETDWKTELERNGNRISSKEIVPENVINNMLAKLTPPMPQEAKSVKWNCV